MIVIGIDPGPEESAFVVWDGEKILRAGEMGNGLLLYEFQYRENLTPPMKDAAIAIEQIRGFGVIASDKLFDTCHWTGRFVQAWGENVCRMVPRKKVIAHLCGLGAKGNDRFVREALIARIGEPGTKKEPGPTYGLSGHKWAALAVAVTHYDSVTSLGGESEKGGLT
jgi:hypothetical protein